MTTDRTVHDQESAIASPWTIGERFRMLLFEWSWFLLCRWTPKPLNGWRLAVLRLFGCHVDGRPFVHPRARIQVPWRVRLADGATIGDRTNLYSLGEIVIGRRAIVAQEAYLSTGSHEFSRRHMPLVTDRIVVGDDAFVGARAILLPGVQIGERSIVGAGSVVTRDVPSNTIVAGNPSRPLRSRSDECSGPATDLAECHSPVE